MAKAADQLGQGNFDVTLPVTQAIELNQLTRRFGLMADALRKHQATNVDELLAGQQRLQAVLDSIDDGLLIIDRQGHLEHLNPVASVSWDGTPAVSAAAWPKRCSARNWSSNCARCCAAAAWIVRLTT